ncbi:putative NAC domain-containing protein 66-like [Capsicum annuum]|nr:putative NAC domain-containing protein 66-like [Capsicum annuum]
MAIPQWRPTAHPAPLMTPVFVVPLPSEAPTLDVHPSVVLPHSVREPTFKLTGPYGYTQPPEFPLNTEKPVMTEEQEEMTQKVKSLELAMKNFQGLWGYKSVSYKDLCMFPGVNLPLGFKMPKFENYDEYGDLVAHLRRYCNQLRGARGKEELLMTYFGESLSSLASEWFVDQDIDRWNSQDDLANEFVK